MAGRQYNQRITADIVPLAMDLSEEDEEEHENIFRNPKRKLIGDFGRASVLEPPASEHMKVFLRVRPFTEEELNKGEDQGCLTNETNQVVTTHAPKDSHYYKNTARNTCRSTTKYTFSHIFNADTTQKDFFNQTMLGLVKDFIDGQNCLVFSYGVTNSGKTYTIQGNAKDGGVLPRALDVLFNSISGRQWEGMDLKPDLFMSVTRLSSDKELMEQKIKERVMGLGQDDDLDVMSLLGDDASDISTATNTTACSEGSNISTMSIMDNKDSLDNSDKLLEEINNRVREEAKVSVDEQGQIKFSVWVSFAEIYNEQIHDLLEPVSKKKNAKRPCLKLSDDQNGSPYIKGLKYIKVCSADEAYKLMTIGQRNLKTACTRLNHNSSRSHCIFNIKILRVVDKEGPHVARVSMLSLCDLAGSERYGKTQASGDRLKEAGNINTSLLTLGRCIETLRHNQAHKALIKLLNKRSLVKIRHLEMDLRAIETARDFTRVKEREHSRIVPFRESKLTRLFQNFFIGRGKAIMFVNVNQCASMFDETQHVFKFSAIASQVVVQQKPIFIKPKLPVTQSLNPIPRTSISWATPARNKAAAEQKAVENIPLPEDSDEDLEEEEDGEVYTRENIDELLGVIEILQKDLEREIKEKDLLESTIRKEVCEEMMKQFTQIEEECSERIRAREQMAEEYAEKRIQILMDAERGRKKKQDVMTDEDDEWVSSVLLHQEKVKVEERDKTIGCMKEEMEGLKEKVCQLSDCQEKLQKEKDNLEKQLSEAQAKLTDGETVVDNRHATEMEELRQKINEYEEKVQTLEKELTKKCEPVPEESRKADLIENLSQQLQQSRQHIKEQEKEISELNDMLTEAGDTFQQKQVEIDKLQELNTEYEKKLETQGEALAVLERAAADSKVAIETADQSLTQREECVSGLQAQIRELEGEVNKYRNKSHYFEQQLVEKEEESAHLRHKVETMLADHAKSQEALIHGFTAEIGNYKTQLFQLKAQLCGVKSPTKSPGGSLRSPGGTIRSPLARMELFPMSPLAAEKTHHQHQGHGVSSPGKQGESGDKEGVSGVNKQMTVPQSELDKITAKVSELEHQLCISKSSVDELERQLVAEKSKHEEARNKVEQLEAKLKNVEGKGSSDGPLQEKQTELEKANDKIRELESLMKDYFSKSKQLTDSEHKIKDLQGMVDEKQSCVKELESEIVKLKATIEEKDRTVEQLEERKEELEVVNKELKAMVNRTTTDLEAKEVEIKALSPKVLKSVKNHMLIKTEDLHHESPIVKEKNKEIISLSTKVHKLKAGMRQKELFCSETTEKCKELEFRIDEKEIESQDLKQDLEKSSHKIEDLQAALETKMKELATTGEELAVVTITMEKLKRSVAEIRADNKRLRIQNSKEDKGSGVDSAEAGLRAEVEKLQELLRLSKADCDELAGKIQDQQNAKVKVGELESLLKQKEERIGEMNERLVEVESKGLLESQCKEGKDAQNDIEKMKKTIAEKDEEIEMFSQNLNSVLEEREEEEIVKSNIVKQLKETKSKLADKESLSSQLQEQLELAQKSVEALKEDVKQLQNTCVQKEDELSDLKSKISSLNAGTWGKELLENSLHDLESAVADSAVELGDKDKLLEEKGSEILDLKSQLELLKEASSETEVSRQFERLNQVLKEKESLQNTNEELEKCVQDLRKELKCKMSEIKSQEEEIKTVREQLKPYKEVSVEKCEKATETCSDLHNLCTNSDEDEDDRLSNALIDIAKLKASEHAQRALHQKVKGELQEALLEVENNRCELTRLRENVCKVEQLEKLVEAKCAELEKAENVISELREKGDMTKEGKDELNCEIEKKNTEMKYLQHQLEKVEKLLNISNEKVALHDRINADLREEYARNLESKQRELQQNEEKFVCLENELTTLNETTKETTVTILKLKQKIETIESDLNDKSSRIEDLEKELQEAYDSKDDLEEELEEKNEQIKDMQKTADQEKQSENTNDERLRDAINEIEQLKSAEHKLKASNNNVKGELQEALLEIENCRSEMESLKKKICKVEDLEKSIESRTSELHEAEKQLDTINNELGEKERQLEVRTSELSVTEKDLDTKTSQLSEKEKELDAINSQLSEREKDLDAKTSELSDTEKHEAQTSQLQEVEKNLDIKTSKLNEAEETISEMKCKIDQMEKEKATTQNSAPQDPLLHRKLNTVVSKLNETEMKNRSLIKEVTQLQSAVEKLEGELQEAREAGDVPSEREIHRRSRASYLADPRQSISSPTTKVELVKSKEREHRLTEELRKASATMQDWLAKFRDAENKLQQKAQELSHARQTIEHLKTQQSEIARSTDQELEQFMDQNNELKVQILKKEGDLEAKALIIVDLERKLHTELGDLKAAEKDQREKAEMISLMKETLNDQDTILQQQEELLNTKDAEIQACDAEYKELQQKYQALLETKNSVKQSDLADQKTVARTEAERDLLREQLASMETRLQETEMRLHGAEKELEAARRCQADLEALVTKAVEEKDKLGCVIRENNQELKELEKSLTESRRECEDLRSQGADKCAETRLTEAQRDWDKTVKELNVKIKNLQCSNKELRFNVSNLEKRLEGCQEDKHDLEKKLQDFRAERDKLVSGLEAVLKKKDAEVRQHKDVIKHLKEKEIQLTKSWHDERLKIAEGLNDLNHHTFDVKTEVPDESYEPASPTKLDGSDEPDGSHRDTQQTPRTRSNSRSRPPRPASAPKISHENDEEEPVERTQIQMLKESPGPARRPNSSGDRKSASANKRGSTARRGRKRRSPSSQDENLPPLPKRRSKDSVADASMLSEASEDYSSHLQIDATPTVAAKTLRRTRKKNGSQLDLSKTEEEKPATSKRPSRQAKRSAKHRLLESFRESPMGKTSKRLLDNIAEAFSPRSPSKSPSKSPRKEEGIKRSKSESKENIPASALDPPEKRKAAGKGRRHKLYSDDYISEPFETTGDFVQSPDDIHQTVTRSLRSRRH